jgi:hypothetical protein
MHPVNTIKQPDDREFHCEILTVPRVSSSGNNIRSQILSAVTPSYFHVALFVSPYASPCAVTTFAAQQMPFSLHHTASFRSARRSAGEVCSTGECGVARRFDKSLMHADKVIINLRALVHCLSQTFDSLLQIRRNFSRR